MNDLHFSADTDKQQVFSAIADQLQALNIAVIDTDLDRPWGGFFVIDDDSTQAFIEAFYAGHSYDEIAHGHSMTPKILVVAPGMRLSWQYHHRRQEMWSVVAGPVGVMTSETDEPGPLETLQAGQFTSFGAEVRHRLIGLENYGVVAEFWMHTEPSNPSNEDDIVRVEDDFSRN